MTYAEALQKARSVKGPKLYDEPGLQAPAIDPIQLIAGLLGPQILEGLLPAAETTAAPVVSQADRLLARLRANQPKIAAGMAEENLPKFIQDRFQNVGLPSSPSPMDSATAFPLKAPDPGDPLSHIYHSQTSQEGLGSLRFYPDWLRAAAKLFSHRSQN